MDLWRRLSEESRQSRKDMQREMSAASRQSRMAAVYDLMYAEDGATLTEQRALHRQLGASTEELAYRLQSEELMMAVEVARVYRQDPTGHQDPIRYAHLIRYQDLIRHRRRALGQDLRHRQDLNVDDFVNAQKSHEEELYSSRSYHTDHRLAQELARATYAYSGMDQEAIIRDIVAKDSRPSSKGISKPSSWQFATSQIPSKVTGHNPYPNEQRSGLSSWHDVRAQHPSQKNIQQCISCFCDLHINKLAAVPCGHRYCKDCLSELFKTSMKDESIFPPRCCNQTIIKKKVEHLLPYAIGKDFDLKHEEFSTIKRLYCRNQKCTKFIPLAAISFDIGVCSCCKYKTCAICQKEPHPGAICPKDEGMKALLKLAEEKHFQSCSSCSRLVEKIDGCFHMRCHCKYEFCYVCGKKWRSCACDQRSTPHLLQPVQTRV